MFCFLSIASLLRMALQIVAADEVLRLYNHPSTARDVLMAGSWGGLLPHMY